MTTEVYIYHLEAAQYNQSGLWSLEQVGIQGLAQRYLIGGNEEEGSSGFFLHLLYIYPAGPGIKLE